MDELEWSEVSYSRWISSDFYTFWCSSKAKRREDEEFACYYSLDKCPHFRYTEVQEMIETPELMRDKIVDDLNDNDIHELLAYMGRFIADVDQHYNDKLSNIRGGQ